MQNVSMKYMHGTICYSIKYMTMYACNWHFDLISTWIEAGKVTK